MKSFRLTPCAAAVAIATLQMSTPAQALNCTLTTNGLWQTTTDWSCGARPGSGDTATINVGGLVSINQAEQITTLSNAGTITIDAFTLTLLGGGSTTNTGTINVGGASTGALQMFNNINNAGGTINVGNGSSFNQFGAQISGGTINTTGTGALVSTNSNANYLIGVALNGKLDMATAQGIERVQGNLALNGAINVNNNSILSFEGANTLSGNGTITLGDTGGSNRLGIDNTGVLTTGANILIHGQNGTIGQALNIGGASTLNNGGTLTADVSGGTINLVASQTNNSNTLAAQNGGTLVLGGNVTQTAGATAIAVGAGSQIVQNGVTVTGGTVGGTSGGAYVAANNGNNYLSGVKVAGLFDMATAIGQERVVGGMTLNSGSNLAVNNNSILSFEGTNLLTGSGTITFGDTGGSNRLGIDNTGTLTVDTNVLIHGQNGNIGQAINIGGAGTLINKGTISADVAGGQIEIVAATTNMGTLSANNGGTLLLSRNVTGIASSLISAGASSQVIQNGITVSGAINTSGSGRFTASNNGSNLFNGVTFAGSLDLASAAAIERVQNGLTLNAATINLNANSILSFEGTQALSGTGSIVLGDAGSSNRIGIDNGGQLTVGSGITIHGQNGTIGQAIFIGGAGSLVNNGTISADVAGGNIQLVAATTNNGTLSALNGGTLHLQANVTGGAGSSINAGSGSTVYQEGVTLSGVINTTGSGLFAATNNGSNVLNGVTFNGVLDVAANVGIERVVGNLALNGTIKVNNNSILNFEGNNTLSGNSTITLGDSGSSNRIGIDGGGTLTTSSTTLIHGQNGTIGGAPFIGGTPTLINNGTISADVAGGNIQLVAATTNHGTLSALNGGTLHLQANVTGTSGSSINAGAGSTVLQEGVTLSGIINTTGTGSFVATNNGNNYLNGVTLNGVLDLATTLGQERVLNNLALNGAINVNNNSILSFEGVNTLSGSSTITLGDTGSSNRVGIDGSGTLTTSATTLIHGQNGTIGQALNLGGPSTLNNGGTVSADVSGGTINLVASTTNNSKTLAAQNGGTLVLSGLVNQTAGGTAIAVGSGSTIVQNGVTVSGGTVGGTAGGAFTATNNGSNVLTGVAVTGLVDLATSNGQERVNGGMTLNSGSNIAVNANSILSFEGNNLLTGSGSITLGSSGASNRIGIDAAGTLTVDTNVLIHGQNGTIGQALNFGGASTLVNKGTIAADVPGGTIAIVASTVTNNGLLHANGGQLTVSGAFNGTGTAQTSGSGQLVLGGSSTVGNLINNGTTATALALGANNITVSGDYSNANFGTGNSFNKRANVSGTGQILAAGDTSQVVFGSTVTNGGTATPTLTIGNVHVGSTTYNYQIGNGGTSGAAIRGAIETSVNGGNITDSRLSGTGVTASNYGPIGTGSNSGDLGVKFTAATSGTLAPLTGQAVHIANNFGNVGEQTLNIVLGAGAAAYNYAAGSAAPSPIVFANAHVNDTRSQVITVKNTAPSGSFTEGLDAAFGTNTGNALNNGGSVSLLAGGASNSSALVASLNTSAAGARSGTVTVNFQSDGTGTSGLGTVGVGSQTINVSGAVYNLASSSTVGPIAFGVRHVGDGVITQNISVTNTAATGAFSEGLDTSFGAFSGTGGSKITTSGSVTNLAAGSTNVAGTLQVKLDTSTVGMVNGTLHINQASNGTISGLANTALPGQDPTVTADVQSGGVVVRYASPQINTTTPVNFGAVRQGTTQSTELSITNNVPNDGFSESLIAGVAGTTGAATGSGGFGPPTAIASLAPSATDSTHLIVGVNTTAAGHQTGNVSVNFKSDGTAFTGGTVTDLGNTSVGVQADVYRLANATLSTPSITVAARVGDAPTTRTISITNTSPDIYTEGLTVTRGATSAGFTGSGSITNLTAGGTSTAIGVALNTSTAGTFTGTQALNYVSTGTGTTGAADMSVGSGSVTLNGKVYTPAIAQANTTAVNFGIVHVGDTVAQQNVSVTNAALNTGTNDVLLSSFASATGPFTGSGNLGAGLGAQQTSASALKVGLNTTNAGVYSGSATFSAASHDGDLSDQALANLAVSLTGQVNNYASDRFTFGSGSGTLSRSGSTFILDYGTVAQGSGVRSTTLFATNDAAGPADALDGIFQFLDAADFGESGFTSFSDLAAGQSTSGLSLSFDSMSLGSFTDSIVLHGVGHNASGYSDGIGDITLIVRGAVSSATTTVPEPDSLLLFILGVPVLLVRRGRKARQQRAH